MRPVHPALLLTLLTSSTAVAADEAALRRCRGIADPVARLACYDGIATAPAAAPASPRAAPTPATPGTAAPAAPAVERFGLEQKAAREAETRQLDRVESHIPGRFEGWRPNARIRLANGQVWQIVDDSSMPMLKDNPKVVIRRGIFSNFFMDIEGDNRSPRVKRVQ